MIHTATFLPLIIGAILNVWLMVKWLRPLKEETDAIEQFD